MSSRPTTKRGTYAKTAKRKEQIIDAATSVFAARGYNGGSLREIATQIEVSLTSLVHHFPNKTDLLAAVLHHADELYVEDFDVVAEQRGLRVAVLELVARNFGHPELLRLFAILAPECSAPSHPGYKWFQERYSRLRRAYEERFAFDQTQGRLPADADPAALAMMLIGVWDGVQLQWLIDPAVDMTLAIETFFDEIGSTAD